MSKKSFAILKAKQDKTSPYAHTGNVSLNFEAFEELDRVDQLDLLDDWISILQVYRDAVRTRYHKEAQLP